MSRPVLLVIKAIGGSMDQDLVDSLHGIHELVGIPLVVLDAGLELAGLTDEQLQSIGLQRIR